MKLRLVVPLAAALALTGAGMAAAAPPPAKPAMKSGTAPAAATTNALGSYARVASYTYTAAPGGFNYATAYCPFGMRVLGGGGSNTDMGGVVLTDSYPGGDTTWTIYVRNNAPHPVSFTAWAICGT